MTGEITSLNVRLPYAWNRDQQGDDRVRSESPSKTGVRRARVLLWTATHHAGRLRHLSKGPAFPAPDEIQHQDYSSRNPKDCRNHCITHRVELLFLTTVLTHHREQILEHLQQPRPGRNQQHGRHNKEKDREDKFNTNLTRPFFRLLAPAHAQEVGMNAQRLRHTGAELIGLD